MFALSLKILSQAFLYLLGTFCFVNKTFFCKLALFYLATKFTSIVSTFEWNCWSKFCTDFQGKIILLDLMQNVLKFYSFKRRILRIKHGIFFVVFAPFIVSTEALIILIRRQLQKKRSEKLVFKNRYIYINNRKL